MKAGRASVALALGAILAGSGEAGAQDDTKAWQRRYRYEHDGGRTAGGSGMVVMYDLTVGPSGARGGCLVTIQGFQTDERIVCHAGGDATTLAVTFHGYADGKLVNRYGVASYKPGQTLFTLRKSPDGGLLTTWEGLKPDEKTTGPGLYFKPSS